MGRLPAVSRLLGGATALLACSWLFGCENDAERRTSAPAERSQAVQGVATPTPAPTPAAPSAAAKPATPKPHRALCGGKLDAEGRSAPKKSLSRRAAAGEGEVPSELTLTGGYTWVNFWAAWCVPCREEIPLLLGWQKQLAGGKKRFRVAFVSLDDDERQLEKFLNDQPAGGLRATYWLREGREREDWLLGAGVDPDPELPVHLLVDEKGKVRCRVQGAVDEADFASLQRLLEG